ncbi:MAG: hypothetical protein U9Q06_01845 [Nanoarchaeota archaeon]|nr:hypothetical protein [Nanoarchaeota archaeon]
MERITIFIKGKSKERRGDLKNLEERSISEQVIGFLNLKMKKI